MDGFVEAFFLFEMLRFFIVVTVVFVECDIGVREIIDELVLSDEEDVFSGDGVVDGGGEVGVGVVEGVYLVIVDV